MHCLSLHLKFVSLYFAERVRRHRHLPDYVSNLEISLNTGVPQIWNLARQVCHKQVHSPARVCSRDLNYQQMYSIMKILLDDAIQADTAYVQRLKARLS